MEGHNSRFNCLQFDQAIEFILTLIVAGGKLEGTSVSFDDSNVSDAGSIAAGKGTTQAVLEAIIKNAVSKVEFIEGESKFRITRLDGTHRDIEISIPSSAADVTYQNNTEQTSATNVQSAINDLFTKIENIKPIGGSGVTPEQIKQAVQEWLSAHPEATIPDGSVTFDKFANEVKNRPVLNVRGDDYSNGIPEFLLGTGGGTNILDVIGNGGIKVLTSTLGGRKAIIIDATGVKAGLTDEDLSRLLDKKVSIINLNEQKDEVITTDVFVPVADIGFGKAIQSRRNSLFPISGGAIRIDEYLEGYYSVMQMQGVGYALLGYVVDAEEQMIVDVNIQSVDRFVTTDSETSSWTASKWVEECKKLFADNVAADIENLSERVESAESTLNQHSNTIQNLSNSKAEKGKITELENSIKEISAQVNGIDVTSIEQAKNSAQAAATAASSTKESIESTLANLSSQGEDAVIAAQGALIENMSVVLFAEKSNTMTLTKKNYTHKLIENLELRKGEEYQFTIKLGSPIPSAGYPRLFSSAGTSLTYGSIAANVTEFSFTYTPNDNLYGAYFGYNPGDSDAVVGVSVSAVVKLGKSLLDKVNEQSLSQGIFYSSSELINI